MIAYAGPGAAALQLGQQMRLHFVNLAAGLWYLLRNCPKGVLDVQAESVADQKAKALPECVHLH